MANKNINMSKLRQIIKLYCQHQGTRTIRDLTGVSRNTVKKYIAQFKFLKTTWDELSRLSDQDMDDLFHEEVVLDPPERLVELYTYFPEVEKRLRGPGMTLQHLWKDYVEKYPDGYA